MEAKLKEKLFELIHTKYPSMDAEMDIDWDVAEISFKAGYEQRQAELRIEVGSIAFKKGKKAGIKEVAEWIKGNGKEIECLFEARIGEIAIDYEAWQAFLKSKGIKEDN